MRCGAKLGQHVCPGTLEAVIDRIGRVTVTCALCVRRKAGRCQRCPARVAGAVGKSLYCPACRVIVLREQALAFWYRDHEKAKRRSRERQAVTRQARRGGRRAMTPRENGRLRGRRRAEVLSPERRREIARLAGIASGRSRRLARQGCS